LSLFPNPPEFYAFAIHTIYAIILAVSFQTAQDLFIPFSKIEDYGEMVNTVAVFFVYMLLISGWIGYTRSISERPHRSSPLGNIRFILDIIIVFIVFYLTALLRPETFHNNFSEVFWWILPVLFTLYVFWDFVKLYEYKEISSDEEENKIEFEINKTRFWKTFYFFIAILVLALVFYLHITQIVIINPSLTNYDRMYFFFIVLSSVIILLFRLVKWGIPRKMTYT
jgi:hypothetical protein